MPKRGENVYKRKDGRWEGRYINARDSLTSKAKYGYVYGRSYNECRTAKAKAESEIKGAAVSNKTMTVSEGLECWMEEKKAEPGIHSGTLQLYAHHIEKHLIPQLGSMRLQLITGEVLQKFRLRQLREGRLDRRGGLACSTVNTQMTILLGMLGYAKEHNWIIQMPKMTGKRLGRETQEREARVLERWEQSRLEEKLMEGFQDKDRTYHGVCVGVLLSLYTGLRVGELSGLQWRDISFEQATVTVRHTLQRIKAQEGGSKTQLKLGPPKTPQSKRTLPLNQFLMQLLKVHYAELNSGEKRPTDYVCTFRGNPIEPRLFQRGFKRLLGEAGVSDGNFHCLRHTFATRCLEQGIDLQSLCEILGHSNATITAKKYAHALREHKAACMERLVFFAPSVFRQQGQAPSQILVRHG